jgi:hypothetical protein
VDAAPAWSVPYASPAAKAGAVNNAAVTAVAINVRFMVILPFNIEATAVH